MRYKMKKGRFVLVILHSYGVGYMGGVFELRPQDLGANTCKHIIEYSI